MNKMLHKTKNFSFYKNLSQKWFSMLLVKIFLLSTSCLSFGNEEHFQVFIKIVMLIYWEKL